MATGRDDKREGGGQRREAKILKGVANYLHVFKPRYDDDDKDKEGVYQCVLSWPKKDEEQTERLEDWIDEAVEAEWGTKALDLLDKGKIHSPIRDGSDSDDANFKKCWVITTRRLERLGPPGVVDSNVEKIMDQTEIYSGCEVQVSISLYPYDYKGKKGIGVGLNNIMKLDDGERRGGGSRAEDDFKPLGGGTAKRRSRTSDVARDQEKAGRAMSRRGSANDDDEDDDR